MTAARRYTNRVSHPDVRFRWPMSVRRHCIRYDVEASKGRKVRYLAASKHRPRRTL